LADRSAAAAERHRLEGAIAEPYMVGVTNLTLTPSAAKRVAMIAEKQAKPAVLRLAVDGGGCAGFSYRFALGEPEEGDTVAETEGVRLVVDPVSLDLLDGSEIDYVEDLGGSAFKVKNPNAASGCGCGSSFGI
jgi:iron-sulfur cluster assembly accessory protein